MSSLQSTDEFSKSMEGSWVSGHEIEVAGTRVGALASLKPLYDPKSERVKA